MDLIHLPRAAKELGVSYPTLKQWIYRGKIRSIKTPGGHHRIPRAEIDRVLFQPGAARKKTTRTIPSRSRQLALPPAEGSGLGHMISGRNQLLGRVTSLERVGLLAKVTLDIGGQSVTSIITRDACRELGLKVGDTAAALIKATEVMIIRPTLRRE
jgi:molybdopterin-binding protein